MSFWADFDIRSFRVWRWVSDVVVLSVWPKMDNSNCGQILTSDDFIHIGNISGIIMSSFCVVWGGHGSLFSGGFQHKLMNGNRGEP